MEHITFVLVMLSLGENLLVGTLVFSLLSIKILDKKFFILVIILTLANLTIRSLPVIPLIIILISSLIYMIYLRLFYGVSVVITAISAGLSILVYMFVEGIIIPLLLELSGYTYNDVFAIDKLRLLAFLFQSSVMMIIILFVRRFSVNLKALSRIFNFEDLEILADDEIDLSRERRVTITFYLVILFLLFQGMFINSFILSNKVFELLKINNFFTAPLFANTLIVVLNLILLLLLRYLIITLRMERNDIIKRIKEKNALRLDWEKRAQMHDRNHHLSMLYMLLQVNHIDRAKEYLKGMVGEIQNVEAIVKSGNITLNALIRSKIARAKQVGIAIKIDVLNRLKEMNVYDWELNRIIGNLLDNAIEAVENKKGSKVVELIIEGSVEHNRIEVITHGVVISDEVKSKIFQRGYSSKGEKGHGLGLAICKELIDEYHGRIVIRKDIEKEYTSFEVLLPVSSDEI